jgi:hypothetical protein
MGLGIDYSTVERLIAEDTVAKLAYDEVVAREPGGANNPLGLGGKSGKTGDIDTLDIIQVDNQPVPTAPTGTSEAAGLRRLRKAEIARPRNCRNMPL